MFAEDDIPDKEFPVQDESKGRVPSAFPASEGSTNTDGGLDRRNPLDFTLV